jgi:predicted MPP superfamily phosphohydrolase
VSAGPAVHALALAGAFVAPAVLIIAWFALPAARRFVRMVALALAIPYLLGVYAFLIEPQLLFVRRVDVASAKWTGPPLRIGVITDTHVGVSHMPPKRMAAIVARMNAERPDVVLLLGDYAPFHEPASVRAAPERSIVQQGIEALGALKAPKGVYAVIGNHDVWYDIDTIRAALLRANLVVLENDAAPLAGTNAFLVGLAEYSERNPDYTSAAAKAPAGAPLIALMHWPDSFASIDDRAALSLAGHTHCGQMGVPILNQIMVASEASRHFRCGLYVVDGKPLYVSGGVGTSILPMRFLAPPEIGIVTLRGQ